MECFAIHPFETPSAADLLLEGLHAVSAIEVLVGQQVHGIFGVQGGQRRESPTETSAVGK